MEKVDSQDQGGDKERGFPSDNRKSGAWWDGKCLNKRMIDVGILFGSIIYMFFATIGILLGSLALLLGIFLSISEFLFSGPLIVLMLVLGLIFRPLLPWLILLVGLYFLFRVSKGRVT